MNIYGKTNIPVMQKEYSGVLSNTTLTKVNNQSNTISVEINQNILDKIAELEERIQALENKVDGGDN